LLKAGQAQRAEEQARLILNGLPQEPNTVFLLAKARHLLGASAEAVELLDSLIARRRDWLSVHQEKGLILRACGDLAGAVASLREVVRLDPTRASAWGLIADMLTSLGEQTAADEAMREYLKAASRPEVLIKAAGLVAQSRLAEAEPLCREYLRHCPDDADAWRLLAEIALRLGIFDDAEQLYARCIALKPGFHFARAAYAHVLMKQGKFQQSLVHIDHLLAVDSDRSAYRILFASVLIRVGRHEEAIDNYERVVEKPGHTALDLASLGHALKTIGPDLHRRPAALGLDPDGADPGQPLGGRGHHGAARHRLIAARLDRRPPRTPRAIRRPSGPLSATRRRSARSYLARTRIQRKLGRPFFIDKMPNNFQHLGLIQLILPNATIIDARRHPLATCFSASSSTSPAARPSPTTSPTSAATTATTWA
jgi:tetratricopeptide (TPR) repeat protein